MPRGRLGRSVFTRWRDRSFGWISHQPYTFSQVPLATPYMPILCLYIADVVLAFSEVTLSMLSCRLIQRITASPHVALIGRSIHARSRLLFIPICTDRCIVSGKCGMKMYSTFSTPSSSSPFFQSALHMTPGLTLAVTLAATAITLHNLHLTPVTSVPLALIIGASFNNLIGIPLMCRPGLKLASSKVLQIGIICIGAKLSITEVVELGSIGVPCVASKNYVRLTFI